MMKFAGTFYPKTKNELQRYFEHFNQLLDTSSFDKSLYKIKPKMIIVPHAGYVYSGFTANVAYRIASFYEYDQIIVIAPSHHHYFRSISWCKEEQYKTPLGDLKIFDDSKYTYIQEAHNEHASEVQMPFIKHYFCDVQVAEVVYGDISSELLVPLLEKYIKERVLLVISTDLSHFYTQQKANELDNFCLNAIAKLDRGYLSQCEACGKRGVDAAIAVASANNFHSHILDYRTSFDASNDASRVVGYASAVIY